MEDEILSKENDAANAKQALYKNFTEYVENNPEEVYIDYRDQLSDNQVQLVLNGKADEVRTFIEDGLWPSAYFDDQSWRQLLNNTHSYITATMWEVPWYFNNWAYGQPITYSHVKEALKVLGINPAEFKALKTGGSATSGEGQFKGYFPNMPNRVPKVKIKDLYDNMVALYDGVLNFCLSNLEEVAEVMEGDSKYVTFKAGTNVVMYNFGNGSGLTDAQLINDVTVKRSGVEFRNDYTTHYGIQECYGFVGSFWSSGGVRSGK